MGNKRIIKSLEVSDFRGLQGIRTLDFESADIILLFGLNGFGKTSVFDAIEWCLTGRIGRYERYTEAGRKQDFGKEKEVLRNKYATNPNTFAKVTLESGVIFGRRVLSNNNESDYNMGSIIEGCKYGLDSITKEAVKPGLSNSYFSATHILSQETINHFVTSKKPEERYQALSVNFGTAIFTPFESNLQMLLGKFADSEKDLKQKLQSKSELISTLKSQIDSKAKDISNNLKKANDLIEVINNLIADIFHKPLTLKDDIVSMDSIFEEYVSNTKSRANLDHSGAKERLVGLRFLKDNIDTWIKDNKELKHVETSISKDKQLISEIDVIQKSIRTIKSETSSLQEKLKPISVQRSNIQNAIKNLPYYIEVSQKISAIEAAIQKRNEALSVAKEKSPNLEKTLEDKKQETTRFDAKLKELQSVLFEIEKHQQFFSNYQSDQEATAEKISKAKGTLETLRKKSGQYRTILTTLDSSNKPSSIKIVIENPDYRSLIQSELVNMLTKTMNDINATNVETEKNNGVEKRLADEETKMRNRFSESRQLLSNALTQIDQQQEEHLCPVCDTPHKTQSLIRHIETKLGIEESDTLKDIHTRLIEIRKKKADKQARSEELDRQFKGVLDSLNSSLTASLTTVLSDESLLNKTIDGLLVHKSEIQGKYEQVTSNVDRVLESKPREYSSIVSTLAKGIEQLRKDLKETESAKTEIQNSFSENKKLLRDGLQLNKSNLSEIATLKDTKYVDVHQFLERNGIKSELKKLGEDVNNHLSQVDKDEKRIRDAIKNQESLLTQKTKKIESVLKRQDEKTLRKGILEKEERLSKLRQSLGRFLRRLSTLEISPADYTIQDIKAAEKAAEKELKNQENKFNALDRLLAFITTFKKFNSDNASRKKIERIENEVESLKERNRALGVAKKNLNRLKRKYPSVLKGLIKENLDVDLFNQIYEFLNPHRQFKIIDFNVDVSHNRIGINFNARHSKINARPEFLFSSAQLNTFGICMFLSMALRQNWLDLDTILIDDPIQNLDDINILSFIDFLRSLLDSKTAKKQIVLSTHDERFYDLMVKKFQDYNVKSFRFESYGKLTPDLLTRNAGGRS
jgi:DNA repair exonuclease SbcCD ATPase subunit